jgi:hypothetical protein
MKQSWNQHVDQIATKLCSVCYALKNLKHIVPQSTLQTIYYAYIHSILSYGIIFWGRSSNVSKLFILQKRINRIITNTGVREFCREAFKNMEIMTYSQYIFSLILFAVKNKHLFTSNNEIHIYETRNYLNFHLTTVNLTKFYKGPYILGTKAFNHLPRHKNPGQWYEMLQIISQEVSMSSIFLFNWGVLWAYWWQRHVNWLWFWSYLFYYFVQYFGIPFINLNYASWK